MLPKYASVCFRKERGGKKHEFVRLREGGKEGRRAIYCRLLYPLEVPGGGRGKKKKKITGLGTKTRERGIHSTPKLTEEKRPRGVQRKKSRHLPAQEKKKKGQGVDAAGQAFHFPHEQKKGLAERVTGGKANGRTARGGLKRKGGESKEEGSDISSRYRKISANGDKMLP